MTIEMQTMQVFAPAKINLSLKILGRRDDGFHEIETVVAPISLCDEIGIEKQNNNGIMFRCDDSLVSQPNENLAVRAARVFFESTRIEPAVSIKLNKKIPHGAGLGGGSSDAAAVLLALNALFNTKLPREGLAKMAEPIGSDVPLFVFQSAALCKGRGELVTPVKLQPAIRASSILLLKPHFVVATPWAYSRWESSRELPGVSYAPQQFAGQTLFNALERPVFEKFVFLAQVKRWLLKQAEVAVALMSGSGSTIFAIIQHEPD